MGERQRWEQPLRRIHQEVWDEFSWAEHTWVPSAPERHSVSSVSNTAHWNIQGPWRCLHWIAETQTFPLLRWASHNQSAQGLVQVPIWNKKRVCYCPHGGAQEWGARPPEDLVKRGLEIEDVEAEPRGSPSPLVGKERQPKIIAIFLIQLQIKRTRIQIHRQDSYQEE